VHIFSKQSTSSTIFAQILHKLSQIFPNLSEKNYMKTWPPKKNDCTFILGAIL